MILSDLKIGDEVLIRGTIDSKASPSVWLVVDGASIGRVVKMPADVVAVRTGRSPNYERTLLTPEERRIRRLASAKKSNAKRRGHENREPQH